MSRKTIQRMHWLLLAALLVPLGGCEFSCKADANDNPIEELGDKIEDATD